MRPATHEKATGMLRKTYQALGFKNKKVTRSSRIRKAREDGSFGNHYAVTKK